MGADETRSAIETANQAWASWRERTGKERSHVLRRWYELIMQNQEDLALLLSLEQGKPLAESRGEIAYGASFVEWFAEEAKRIYGDTIPGQTADKRNRCAQAAHWCCCRHYTVEFSGRDDHP